MAVLDELLVRLGVDMSEAEAETERGTQGMLDSLGGLAGAGTLAAAGLGVAFSAGLAEAMDASAATEKLQNGLGLTDDEAARAGSLAGDVFSAGFSDSMGGVTDAMGSVIGAMGSVGDFTDAELKQMTKSAIALGDTFGIDIPEAANAAGALIKQGLVKDGTEAFDVLTKAAQTLPANMAADIPAVVSEYGTHFKRIGIDAQTAFGLMSQFVQAGGRDIDQAADVLHEFARITSEETPRAAEGFKALGLDANKMLTDIGKGGKPAADALDLTLDALRGVKDPAKQAELGVALFGDMAGEAAGALLAMDPASAAAASGMDQAAGAAARVTEGMENSPAQQFEAIMRQLTVTLGAALLPVLQFVSGLFAKYPGLMQVVVPVVLALAAGLAIAAAAQWAMNSAVLANPYTWVVVAIIALVAAIIVMWKNWDTVTKNMGAMWDWLVDKFWGGWDWLVRNVFNPIGRFFTSTIPGWVSTGVQWIVDEWNGVIGWFAGIPGRLAQGARGMWNFISDGLKGALNGAIGLVNDGIWYINDKLISNANRIPGVDIPYIPYIPYLAAGGITTGPTMAMIGEGREQEAVMPLSKLQNLLDFTAMQSVNMRKVQPAAENRTVLELRGGSRAFREFLQESVRTEAGGDIIKYAGGE